MDFFGAIVGGLLTTVTYVVIFFGVYKLFQIAVDIREIKDLVANARRVPQGAAPYASVSAPTVAPGITRNLAGQEAQRRYLRTNCGNICYTEVSCYAIRRRGVPG